MRRASSPCGEPFWCGANSNQKLSPQAGKVDTNGVSGRKGNGSEIPSAAICSPSVTACAATRTLVGIWSSCYAAACNTPYSARFSPRCIAHWARSARIPRKRGRLKLQYKLGVQCRTPSRSDRFNGVTGVARGPKGRNRNLPWPPGKKSIKQLAVLLVWFTPSENSLKANFQFPLRGSLLAWHKPSLLRPIHLLAPAFAFGYHAVGIA